jgi:hypothetical protein
VRRVAEQGDFAEELALLERPKDPLLVADASSYLDPSLMHQVGFSGAGIALSEDHLTRLEDSRRYSRDAATRRGHS